MTCLAIQPVAIQRERSDWRVALRAGRPPRPAGGDWHKADHPARLGLLRQEGYCLVEGASPVKRPFRPQAGYYGGDRTTLVSKITSANEIAPVS